MKNQILKILKKSLKDNNFDVEIELTDSAGHADFSTNIAMKLAGIEKKSPLVIAELIISKIATGNIIDKIEVAGPGFINIFISRNSFQNIVENIIKKDHNFGKLNQNEYINIEYVSANPTGFLHLGHARSAAVGSTLVNVLRFAGNKVDAEYYINDAGNQIEILGQSSFIRYQQLLGKKIELPDDSYKGEDIKEVASFLFDKYGGKFSDSSYEEAKETFKNDSKTYLLEKIKEHLKAYKTIFSIYSSETKIYEENKIKPIIEKLNTHTYVEDGALWLKTTAATDDKDRVLVKSDQSYTYLTPDIAYHDLKLSRKYNQLINIWGADHIGYIERMRSALIFLGLKSEDIHIFTLQLVKLFSDGKELKMSKRKGTTFTLIDLIKEVGADLARWFMIDRSVNSEIIIDVSKMKSQNLDNNAFLVKHVYNKTRDLLGKQKLELKELKYSEKEEALITLLNQFPDLIDSISKTHKVNLLTQFLTTIASQFNAIISQLKEEEILKSNSLFALINITNIVIRNGLDLLGISY